MLSLSRAAKALSVLAAGAAIAMLAGCTSSTATAEEVGTQLPSLESMGFTAFECGTGDNIDHTFDLPEDPYVAQCWEGAPQDPFVTVAESILTEVMLATTGADVSDKACPADVLNETAGIACRAVYVGSDGDDVLVRILVTVVNIEDVIAKLPAEPTQDDVLVALQGAQLEVLIGTEPVTDAAPAASPTS